MNGIRSKLTLAFLIPVIFIMILGILSYLKSSNGLIDSYEKSTLSTMSYMVKYLDFGLKTGKDKVEALKNNEVMRNYYSGAFQKDKKEEGKRYTEVTAQITKDILETNYISNVYIFSNYGKGYSGNGLETAKLNYDNYISGGEGSLLASGDSGKLWAGTHPNLDKLSGINNSVYAISYMSTFSNILGKEIGCIVLDIKYDFIYDTISKSGFPPGSIVALITDDGREIISGGIPADMKLADQLFYQNALSDKKSETSSKYVEFNRGKYLFTYSKIDDGNCMLCSLIPSQMIVAKANQVKNITLLLVIMASITAISLGAVMAYGFGNAIKKVIGTLKQAEQGDLTGSVSMKRKDEFRILGKCINDVIRNIQKLIGKMSGTSNTLSKSAAIVSESSGILVVATKHISDAVNDIETGVSQQAVDAESCLQEMAALAEKINKLYNGIHSMEKIAENTYGSVDSGMGTVNDLSRKVKDTTDITRTVISDIENLAGESKAIAGIVQAINEIAQQTNLLSLNASIEAARAGEYGRGFAVVASEIRKLADQSLQYSEGIKEIIQRIENQTNKTIVTAKYAEEIVMTQEEALLSTVHSFDSINQHVEKLSGNLNEIVIEVEGIEAAKNDTLKAIENISATAEETAAATEELSVTAENQLKEVNKLNDVVQQLNENSYGLEQEMSRFKINSRSKEC